MQRSAHRSLSCCGWTFLISGGEREQQAFDDLKAAMTKGPVLATPDPEKGYTLYTDASDYAVGGSTHAGAERRAANSCVREAPSSTQPSGGGRPTKRSSTPSSMRWRSGGVTCWGDPPWYSPITALLKYFLGQPTLTE